MAFLGAGIINLSGYETENGYGFIKYYKCHYGTCHAG
jgi:hypothetical protein